jgi:hypothetical protein
MSQSPQPPAFEVIGEFEVDPEQQGAFLSALGDQIEQHFRGYAGFISAKVYAGDDGRRALIHGRWNTQHDWEAVFRNPGFDPPTRDVVIRFAAARVGFQCVRSVEHDSRVAR